MELNLGWAGTDQKERPTETAAASAAASGATAENPFELTPAESLSSDHGSAELPPPVAALPETLADEMSTALALIAAAESESGAPADGFPESAVDQAAVESPVQHLLGQHLAWLHSEGRAGCRADLSRQDLTGSDFTDANLRGAALHKTIFRNADLLLTDFQGASLLQADLRGANLLGAKLQDANLQGATLVDATGLQPGQLAGANLFGSALPAQLSLQAELRSLCAMASLAGWMIAALFSLLAMTWLRVITTSDVQLLVNGPVLSFLGLQNVLPIVPFYLFGPVAILGLYIGFHLGLQRLWDAAASQPAIFPDGRRLDSCLPWFARWPARTRMTWLRDHTPSLAALEAAISVLATYWLVPLTMIVFWARYLTMQDMRGTMLHVLLVVAASFAALYFMRAAGRAYASPAAPVQQKSRWMRSAGVPAFGFLLLLLSFGAIRGIPHNAGRGSDASGGPQAWASDLLWWAGYTPTAQLAEADVSVKPAGWTGRDEELASVDGARLNGLRLRYIQAYGAFFAKARLWQADLSHANLSEADLRESNLRQASLASASVDKARLARAILQEADLRWANLTQSDLQDANLSRAMLTGASLLDAKLDGANLYASDLSGSELQRASLQHADLRDAKLEGADLSMAILRQTYLSSAKMSGSRLQGAQLAQAFLTQADLTKADLRGAGLQGAIMNGAILTGANLKQADLRGALGVTAAQVCSAGSLQEIQMDDALQRAVQDLCGSKLQ